MYKEKDDKYIVKSIGYFFIFMVVVTAPVALFLGAVLFVAKLLR